MGILNTSILNLLSLPLFLYTILAIGVFGLALCITLALVDPDLQPTLQDQLLSVLIISFHWIRMYSAYLLRTTLCLVRLVEDSPFFLGADHYVVMVTWTLPGDTTLHLRAVW